MKRFRTLILFLFAAGAAGATPMLPAGALAELMAAKPFPAVCTAPAAVRLVGLLSATPEPDPKKAPRVQRLEWPEGTPSEQKSREIAICAQAMGVTLPKFCTWIWVCNPEPCFGGLPYEEECDCDTSGCTRWNCSWEWDCFPVP